MWIFSKVKLVPHIQSRAFGCFYFSFEALLATLNFLEDLYFSTSTNQLNAFLLGVLKFRLFHFTPARGKS